MSPYCGELRDDFESLACTLLPSNAYIQEVRGAARQIFEQLKQKGRLQHVKIGRTKIAGSIGKGTGVSCCNELGDRINPDLDLVSFLNDLQPPFKDIYEIFQQLLSELEEVSYFKQTKHSIQFSFKTQSFSLINIDLLAAENHVKNTSEWSGYDIGEVQAAFALTDLNAKQMQAIKQTNYVDEDEIKLTSSAFSEKTVDVIRQFIKDDLMGKLVRLAKYWIHMIDLTEFKYVPARSCLMEAIAIHAQLNKKCNESCLISGFRRFLEAVSELRSLDICLVEDIKNRKQFEWVSYSTPMIRDPGNWWNNLAGGFPLGALKVLEQQAKKTLMLLEKVRSKDGYYKYGNAIDEIFLQKQ